MTETLPDIFTVGEAPFLPNFPILCIWVLFFHLKMLVWIILSVVFMRCFSLVSSSPAVDDHQHITTSGADRRTKTKCTALDKGFNDMHFGHRSHFTLDVLYLEYFQLFLALIQPLLMKLFNPTTPFTKSIILLHKTWVAGRQLPWWMDVVQKFSINC